MFKNNIWINVYYTKRKRLCSPWTACSAFNLKYLFWVNLVQKLKIISLSWNFVPRLIQICRIPWWCSLFLFSTGNIFLGKFGPKNQNFQSELKFCTRLIWTSRIMQKICGVYFFCFWPEKPSKLSAKLKLGSKTNLNMRN